jgi:ABC-type uncharacterized transport system ATPase subunit
MAEAGEILLETAALSRRFGGVEAVAGVDFRLRAGELRCLIGPNGAGKSTFFKLLTGQLAPTAGRILYRGRDIAGLPPHAIARLGIGIKNQVPDVFMGLTVRENLDLAARLVRPRPAVDALAERLALTELLAQPVGTLAHGQRQWVEIGMVLARAPQLVLLDEPSAGMSEVETARTAALIREVNRSAALIVVEHDMAFIRQIAGRVTVFHRGRVLVEGSFAKVVADPRVQAVYLGRAWGG